MKLLFDHNLSPRLVQRLADLAPDSMHVLTSGLNEVDDRTVWTFAHTSRYQAIVTKDADFSDFPMLLGFPPKVIRLAIGNCSTQKAESILRARWPEIEHLINDHEAGLLVITAIE